MIYAATNGYHKQILEIKDIVEMAKNYELSNDPSNK
jgi:hypothetical protein